jgi:signal transduction histidine kinase
VKSLYFAVALTLLGTLSLSLVVFLLISGQIEKRHLYPVWEAMDELELEHARSAFTTGGPSAVAAYMQRLDQLFGTSHYLLHSTGVDVASGENRSSLLPRRSVRKSREYIGGRWVITHQSSDGQYWFVAVDPRQPDRWTFFPYYVLVMAVAGLLCWLVAIGVVSPIRRITATLDRFGEGHFSTRLRATRQDEIGALARSFDGMAERIEGLLSSERRLLEDISHELRSPLARLKIAVRLAKTSNEPELAFSRVDREVGRITALVSEIIELTRLEGDPLVRRFESLDFYRLLETVVADAQLEADCRQCHLQLSGYLDTPITGNAELLRRAVENILRNSIRYSPQNSVVEIVIARAASSIHLSVRDRGPGVPEEWLPRLFNPFFQTPGTPHGRNDGFGLGLSIARRAILLHGGTVEAVNRHPGLEVRILLPSS